MHSFIEINLLSFFKTIFLLIVEIVRNKKSIVNALAKTDIILTIRAICSTSLVNSEKKAPSIWKSGAPGGCPICSLDEVEIYSAQSQ